LTIIHKDSDLLAEISRLEDYIKTELNVKKVEYSTEEERFINLYAKPNSPILGKRLGKSFRHYKNLIEHLDAAELSRLQEDGRIDLDGESFSADEILLFREAKPGTEALSNRFISIDMDCGLNEDLVAEGLAREVVNRIQRSRRDLGFNVVDRIKVVYSSSDDLSSAIEKHLPYITTETLANQFVRGSVGDSALQFTIDGHSLSLDLERDSRP
jgi:isoleucyl-tRNA synthetase